MPLIIRTPVADRRLSFALLALLSACCLVTTAVNCECAINFIERLQSKVITYENVGATIVKPNAVCMGLDEEVVGQL